MTEPSAAAFETLLNVQDLDTSLDQHQHRRATLPERAALEAVAARLRAVDTELANAVDGRDVVAARQHQLEATLAATEEREAEVHKRLYGGTVSATRELQAMAAELDALASRASDLESRVLEVMEEREPLDAVVGAIEGEKASLLESRVALQAQLRAGEVEIDGEIDALNEERARAAAGVPAGLLATYSQLRQHLGGVGAARLNGSLCSGCHLRLPATALDRLRRQGPDALIFCDQCGRILVR